MQPEQIGRIDGIITAADFARAMKISVRTLARLRARGEVPGPIKVGGTLRWRAREVRDFLDRPAHEPSIATDEA